MDFHGEFTLNKIRGSRIWFIEKNVSNLGHYMEICVFDEAETV